MFVALCDVFEMPLDEILQRRRNSWLRAFACRSLQVHCGLSHRDIGQLLGVGSGVAVSKQLRQLTVALKEDKDLQSIWKENNMQLVKL